MGKGEISSEGYLLRGTLGSSWATSIIDKSEILFMEVLHLHRIMSCLSASTSVREGRVRNHSRTNILCFIVIMYNDKKIFLDNVP